MRTRSPSRLHIQVCLLLRFTNTKDKLETKEKCVELLTGREIRDADVLEQVGVAGEGRGGEDDEHGDHGKGKRLRRKGHCELAPVLACLSV